MIIRFNGFTKFKLEIIHSGLDSAETHKNRNTVKTVNRKELNKYLKQLKTEYKNSIVNRGDKNMLEIENSALVIIDIQRQTGYGIKIYGNEVAANMTKLVKAAKDFRTTNNSNRTISARTWCHSIRIKRKFTRKHLYNRKDLISAMLEPEFANKIKELGKNK